MPACDYRFREAIVVVIRDAGGYKLRELPAGSVFQATGAKPDSNGMVDGTCNGDVTLIFVRDLNERAVPTYVEPGRHLERLHHGKTIS